MAPHNKLSNSNEDTSIPVVSFLGPVSSYTHQVLTLAHFTRPAWSIGLTDFDLAQAALGCFEADRYDYRPETTITGTTKRAGVHLTI